ncbi:MAG TPA: Gfo/Idh/MocA family oxidoreductase [Chloroflexota bacterium]|nr:Gfo/Idh/MocA family oxidoreductase [Chloroflexota bacterium]
MTEKVGFVTMGEMGEEREVPTFGVGMLGYAFMGKAHTNAYKTLDYIDTPPPARTRLEILGGRSRDKVEAAARRYGYARAVTNWHDLVASPDIQIFDNSAPNNLHAEPCIAAAEAGKHIICEKPLARDAEEAWRMVEAVQKAGVVNMTAFNYRFVPAVRLMHDIIAAGRLGRIYHFRARYLQEWIISPEFEMVWRLDAAEAGSGVLGDLGTHIIDLARYLVGEPESVQGLARTFIPERRTPEGSTAQVTVDDAFAALISFQNGAMGTLEASRFAQGRKNHQVVEINGEKGSLVFNLERLNELEVYLPEEEEPRDAQGFRQVLVTESYHPYYAAWWPQGHIIGWEHTFVHEIRHFLQAIVDGTTVTPHGADFMDGYRAGVVADAILESNRTGRRVDVTYR